VRCATDDLSDYGSMITQIVGHADPVVRDWEIWNEPDTGDYFNGTPQQYARMLRTAHDAIKQVDPQANVLLGGISRPAGMSWLGQVFATPGADAAHAFDIANVHQRGQMISLAPSIAAWKLFLAGHGFLGPLWVTEHGYPSDPAYQYDPGYTSGPASQAAYLAASIPTLVDAGASEVFVTERDDLSGAYASEGVLGGNVSDPPSEDPQPVEKPSYATVAGVAACYLLLARGCPGTPPVATPSSAAMTARRGSTTVSVVTVSDPGATAATARTGRSGPGSLDCARNPAGQLPAHPGSRPGLPAAAFFPSPGCRACRGRSDRAFGLGCAQRDRQRRPAIGLEPHPPARIQRRAQRDGHGGKPQTSPPAGVRRRESTAGSRPYRQNRAQGCRLSALPAHGQRLCSHHATGRQGLSGDGADAPQRPWLGSRRADAPGRRAAIDDPAPRERGLAIATSTSAR
jgi:hypothetical protein